MSIAGLSAPLGPVRVALLGASGRMGQSLLRAIHDSGEFELVGALASPESPALGQDAGDVAGLSRRFDVKLTANRDSALARAEVAIDFTLQIGRASCRERVCVPV